ncbi:PLC-like phosphodiesterase [Annulohypoxylon maeteangense]|uniref:PLC-like phosphodiesterase n=1 Tax=Annulohypoxylon maeteangense TaxID=1927788 RepID=UPI002007D94A|nr:PLC-like phosphodiesterase [Annulohypoxylon maeteangense]KAI0881679.1 PLC-like phosphodiesterase [Annulohypoxylon maeteangense]
MRFSLALSTLALVAGSLAANCNGHAELCNRRYSNITFAGAHNSPFVGIGPSDNQFTSPTDQLKQGIRFLQAQTQEKDGEPEMCHTSCILEDAGTLQSYLSEIKSWVDANPNEVITLLITNPDAIDINKYGDAFKSTGLATYVFTPDGQLGLNDWPTLAEMISSGTRVVVFMDYNMDTSKVPYILDEFGYWFETPFSPTKDNFIQCNIDRPAGAKADGRMFLANHNLNIEILPDILIPDPLQAAKTNSIASITSQTNICVKNYGRNPNVVLLDFVSRGDTIKVQNQLNGL